MTTAKRKKSSKGQWGKLLDFKGKQYLGRIRKQYGDMGLWLGVELACLALALGLLFFCYFRFEAFHYWVCRVYALFGYTEAEHKLGEKFLYGKYVEKNEVVLMQCLLYRVNSYIFRYLISVCQHNNIDRHFFI